MTGPSAPPGLRVLGTILKHHAELVGLHPLARKECSFESAGFFPHRVAGSCDGYDLAATVGFTALATDVPVGLQMR
jgi:hypothetical protein